MGGVPVAVAIIVGLVSSFVQSIGLTIQRKSHLTNDTLPQSSQRRPIRRPLWLLGFGIYISSNIFSTIFQLDALPIVILAPLGAVSLIFNALTARVLLGDTFGPSWIAGTALVAGGAVLIAVFGVVKEDEHGLDEILRLFARKPFVGFFSVECVVTILVLIAAHIAAYHVQRQSNRIALPLSGESTPPPTSIPPSNYASPHSPAPIPFRQTQQRRWSSPTSTEFAPAVTSDDDDVKSSPFKLTRFPSFLRKKSINNDSSPTLCTTNEDMNPEHQRTLTLCGLAFAACSGTLSGMCLVLAKAAVELLVITLDHFRTGKGVNEFARAQTWFLVVGLGICAILQLVYLNYSLAFASPALICPLAFCFFNLSSIFDGLVFYDQFGRLATYQIVLVSLGVAVLLLGVWVVSAIQPGGGAGVEVGTWVEEESVCSVDIDEEPLLGGVVSSEPEAEAIISEQGDGAERRTIGLFGPSPISPESETPDRMIQSYPQPQTQTQTEGIESPLHRSVFSESHSPLSPTFRRKSHHLHHQHRTRYGTLIPDLAPVGAPTGFSIGLGAASPGFVLRSASISVPHPNDGHSHGHGHVHRHGSESGHWRHGRSQSETPAGLMAIIRNTHTHTHSHSNTSGEGESVEDVIHPSHITGTESSPLIVEGEEDNRTEAALRNWDQSDSEIGNESKRGWWASLFGRGKRGIRLED